MGNTLTGFKKFFANKNTVTFLCVILGVIVLYVGYNIRVTQATKPVQVPYAKVAIGPKTQITADMIGRTEVPESIIKQTNIIRNSSNVINKYSSYAAGIPKNSYFYTSAVMEEQEMPDYAFKKMAEGYTVYSLKVNMASTYANKIYPDTYIDLYARIDAKGGQKAIYARLIQSIRVKAVKDDKGRSLLTGGYADGTPSALLFEVPDDLFYLLKKAEYVDGISIEPLPRNSAYTASQGETKVDTKIVEDYILNQCLNFDN